MNDSAIITNSGPATSPPPPIKEDRYALQEMKGPITLFTVCDALLKNPGSIIATCSTKRTAQIFTLLFLIGILSFSAFGFIIGLFSGGDQLWAAPAKVAMGAVATGMITLPSLYVFTCLTGSEISLRGVIVQMLSTMALIGMLLLALSPVTWVFSQSTHTIRFFGILVVAFWGIAMIFGIKHLYRSNRAAGGGKSIYLAIWIAIFVFVMLQMSTSLRPIIGTDDTFLPFEKKFFIDHWMSDHPDF